MKCTTKGTFGSCYFDEKTVIKVTKKKPKNFKYLEPLHLQIASEVISSCKIKMFKVPLVHKYWIEGRKHFLKMDRIFSPNNKHLIICKFWGIIDGYDDDWKNILISDCYKYGYYLQDDDLKNISYELGIFHRAMMENGICVWEVEIMLGKLWGNESLSLFLIDFDKNGIIDFYQKDI